MSNSKIPYGRHNLDDTDLQAVIEVLNSGVITQGQIVEDFGQALADYTGAQYGVALSSGTAALHLAMAAIDIKPGDEVITTPMTFCATSNSVLYMGGKPIFVDIDEDTLNIDPDLIESKITNKTRAIIPVDFRGHPAALPGIKEIADKYGLKVIEDGAHSLGSGYEFEKESFKCGDGIHTDMCTLSFHPVKHITSGEGGAILTNDKSLYEKIQLLRKHGIDRREEMFSDEKRIGTWIYDMEMLGYNYRLTDFQSALGLSQLKKLDQVISRRREIVNYYNDKLSGIDDLILPYEADNVNSNFHLYVIQVKENCKFDRFDLFKYLQSMNYAPMVHYIPVHYLSYYKDRFGFKKGDFPKAEKYYERTISLPLYPSLTDNMVEKVVENISSFIISHR